MEEQNYYLALDSSKGYADVIVLDGKQHPICKSFQIDDNKVGHQALADFVIGLNPSGKLICGIENTGGYEQNWVYQLKRIAGDKMPSLEVYKLNPKAVKHQMQSQLKRTITDSVSAEGIATYMINNYEKLQHNWRRSIDKSSETSEQQQFHKLIMGKIKQQTMQKNQLEKVLYRTFPELLGYCKNSYPKWLLKLLVKYPTSSCVKRAKLKGLMNIKGISEKKAGELKAKAANSVASQDGDITQLMIEEYAQGLLDMDTKITALKQVLVDNYGSSQDLEIVNSVKGIADWSSVAFLIQLGDYKRFDDTKQLASFFGLHPSFKQSGDGKYRNKMSKQGSPAMRAILYIMANNVVLHEPYFKSIYAKHRARGKTHRSAIGVIMHKLLRVLFGMLKSRKLFDKNVDEANQEKHTQQQPQPLSHISATARRMQELSCDAPISRSNYKKRKEVLEHQSSVEDDKAASSKTTPNTNIKNV